ncbi:MAG TPA: response regulator transcription factor [Candidatus Acidoferrum sp.]|jgi:DNA-binding NarL/FixJ family response regulator
MPKSILIVDDSPAVRKVTRLYLETETEFEVCGEAIDGVDALDKARMLKPDLIILDLAMPRMNGLQAARELKKIRENARIVLFTSYADALPERDALFAGAHAVVSKSDPLSVLVERMQDLLAV